MITLTDNASTKVRELISQEGDDALMLRVAVQPKGCSGFSYEMFFDTEQDPDDVVGEYSGVRVVADASSADLLTGATLDYGEGDEGPGFAISNPNAGHGCTCGHGGG